MRRFFSILMVVAMLAAITAFAAVPAFAAGGPAGFVGCACIPAFF